MPNREMVHNVDLKCLLATVAAATTPTQGLSSSVDTLGFDSCTFGVVAGVTAPAPTTIAIEESDDDSTFTTAATADVITDSPTWAASKCVRYGYVGGKRYARIKVTPSAATDITAIIGMLGHPDKRAVDNPR